MYFKFKLFIKVVSNLYGVVLLFGFLCLVYPTVPFSPDCSFLIALSVYPNVSLSCVPYGASFSGLSIFYCTFGIL
jgi:hypothetical protein